jgi:hypothetical protein
MFGNHFYNKNIRNIIILFGTVFNDITVKRVKSDGTVDKHFKVPIAYGPAEKYMTIIEQGQLGQSKGDSGYYPTTDLASSVQRMSLPRMSFEIVTMVYDPTRKLQTTKRIREVKETDETKLSTVYTPVPYNFDIDLSIMVKHSDDGTQILEQILPYFTPEYHVTLNEMATVGVKRDIPIIMNAMNTEDTYEGDMITRRALIHTLSFTVQGYLYGPTKDMGIIREVDANIGANFNDKKDTNIDVKPNPLTADPDDDFGFTTTTTEL